MPDLRPHRDTFLAKPGSLTKGWRIIDASGVPLGRLASEVAIVLMGKDKPSYTPHVDSGDNVVVINGTQVALTGRKAEQRMKQRYSEYPSGLKMESYGAVRQRNPERLIRDAVRRMLPKNRLARVMLKGLHVYADDKHPHAEQKATPIAMPAR